MRFGICVSLENLHLAEKMDCDYLEIGAAAISDLSESEFQKTVEAAETSSLPCSHCNILFPGTIRLLGGKADRGEIKRYLSRTLPRLQKLGVRTAAFGSGRARMRPADLDFSAAYRQLVEVTRLIGQMAGEYGITVAVEPLNRSECNLICSVAEAAMLASDTLLPNVQVLADGYHMQLSGDAPENIARIGRLAHVHVASAEGRKYPLTAEPALCRLFEQLARIAYAGGVSVEAGTSHFEQEAPMALANLRRLEKKYASVPEKS